MQICQPHWTQMREAVDERGMAQLVAKDGAAAAEALVQEAQGGNPPFDPLMAMNMNFWNAALSLGGLGMMSEPPEGEGHTGQDGRRHYCPLCEAKRRGEVPNMDRVWIADCADAMLAHARAEGLVAGVQ